MTRIGNIYFFANVLEGLFGEYHSSSVALGNVLSSQSQLSRVLAGLFSLSRLLSVGFSVVQVVDYYLPTLTPYVKVAAWP